MAVSKRTRFEVFRRDNHTCRYCGARPSDGELTIDHVTPVALGGTDKPDNLATACKDCNAGKASVPPGAPLVDDVKVADLRWAEAIIRVTNARSRQAEQRDAYTQTFYELWLAYRQPAAYLPDDWERSLTRFYDLFVPEVQMKYFVSLTLTNHKIRSDDAFRYFAGCMWREVTELQTAAKEILEGEDVGGS